MSLEFQEYRPRRIPNVHKHADGPWFWDRYLLRPINQSAWMGVVYSISNLDLELKLAFEPRSPGLRRRLQAMQQLAQAANYRIWAYRKAAWTVDDWPEGLDQVYAQGGRQALRDLPDVGPRLADELADRITEA